MSRVLTPELMDDPSADRAELERALRYLRFVNRRLGGASALVARLGRWSRRWSPGERVTILDVGGGSGDIALAAVRWGRSAGFDVRATVVDNHEGTAAVASRAAAGEERVEVVRADALGLMERWPPGSFDYAHAALFLHHLNDVQALTMLRIMDRLSRRGMVWSDLVRSRLVEAGVRASTIGQGRMVRHDAIVSVRAGFTRREAMDMAHRVDAGYLRWSLDWRLYRFVLAGERA